MLFAQSSPRHAIRRGTLLLTPVAFFCLASPAVGEQEYVSRYDAYAGYAFLDSPRLGLFENGFNLQVGFRPKTWYSVGFDYSRTTGDTTIKPDLLPTDLQQTLAAELAQLEAAGLIPPGYQLKFPVHSVTSTFAAGPQLTFRHWTHVTIFVRPVLGAISEQATLHPADPIAAGILAQLVPSGKKTDTTWFVGGGCGFDILFTRHLAMRTQVDLVYDHLFNDLLRDGRATIRFSVGPAFNFGPNIKK